MVGETGKEQTEQKIFFRRNIQTPIQIISTIVVNLTPEGKPPPTLYSSAKIKPALFEKEPRRKWRAGGQLSGAEMSEAEVIFREGEFLSGRDGGNQSVNTVMNVLANRPSLEFFIFAFVFMYCLATETSELRGVLIN